MLLKHNLMAASDIMTACASNESLEQNESAKDAIDQETTHAKGKTFLVNGGIDKKPRPYYNTFRLSMCECY